MDKEVIQRNVLNFWKELYVGDEYENTEGRSLAKDEEQEESTGVEYKDHIFGAANFGRTQLQSSMLFVEAGR